jgi:phenylacetate-CoA ligase
LRHAYNNTPYYHKKFRESNIKPSDIRSFKDLKKIPCTEAIDLQNDPRSFFAVPEEKFIKVFTTSGSTGKPKKAFFTQKDIDKIVLSAAIGGKLLYGITNRDVIRLTFEVGYGTEIWGNSYCLDLAYGRIIGALTIITSRVSIEHELEILREYKPTIFGDVTSRIIFLTKKLSKLCDLGTLGVKKFLIGAEPTPSTVRKNIEEAWNADAYIGYGITEVGLLLSGECEMKNGPHLSELNFHMEVIDPETGEQLEDGETGELYFTTFDREGMPLIRYNSHDLGRIIPDPCECGLPLKRVEIRGRSDDLIPVGAGDNLFTVMFDQVIFTIPEIIEYQVEFDREDGQDVITITAESSVINENIKNKILRAVIKLPEIENGVRKSRTIKTPVVKLVKPGTFNRNSIKFKRLVDKRNLYG